MLEPAARNLTMPQPDRGGPLAGVRVLELTKVWAGPYAGKMLAHLGAEVIKLESAANLDEMRAYGGVDINSAPYFLSINQEILSVQVNMKTAEGLDLVRQMVAQSDVFIDNIRPGALERSRLHYDELRKIKPDIIQCSIKMWGNDGPLGYQTGYAPCFAALSGLTNLVGYEGETPEGMNIRYGDATAGALAALACIAALHHREATGEGQFIDHSAVEAMTSLVGDSLFAYSLTGEVPQSDGNYHPDLCPHGAYPCANREWISIACSAEAEWHALCRELGAEALAADPRFAGLGQRLANRLALDAELGELHRATCRRRARRPIAPRRGCRLSQPVVDRPVQRRLPVGPQRFPHGFRPSQWRAPDHRPVVADGARHGHGDARRAVAGRAQRLCLSRDIGDRAGAAGRSEGAQGGGLGQSRAKLSPACGRRIRSLESEAS